MLVDIHWRNFSNRRFSLSHMSRAKFTKALPWRENVSGVKNCSMTRNIPPKGVRFSDLICIFAMSIVRFSCLFCNTKISEKLLTWQKIIFILL